MAPIEWLSRSQISGNKKSFLLVKKHKFTCIRHSNSRRSTWERLSERSKSSIVSVRSCKGKASRKALSPIENAIPTTIEILWMVPLAKACKGLLMAGKACYIRLITSSIASKEASRTTGIPPCSSCYLRAIEMPADLRWARITTFRLQMRTVRSRSPCIFSGHWRSLGLTQLRMKVMPPSSRWPSNSSLPRRTTQL